MRKVVVSAAMALAVLLAAPVAHATSAGPGCAIFRRAVAHYPGEVVLKPQPKGAPIPCGMQTGYAGGESAIAVTNSGAVFYSPAVYPTAGVETQVFLGGNSGFARTTDEGASWSLVNPIGLNMALPTHVAGIPVDRFSDSLAYPAWDQIDDKFYMDRTTGRLFWTDPDVPSEAVLWTDDDGLTWGFSELPLGLGGEWTQVTTAKPVFSTTSGYPEVVYACGEYDSVSRDISTAFEGDVCQKSLDGGETWIVAGQGFFGAPIGTHPQCGGQTEHPNFSPWAAPDPEGRIYEPLYCNGNAFLIRSSDEGATWPIVAQIPYAIPTAGPGDTGLAELRTDSEGNLYIAWAAPGNPNPNGTYAPGKVYLGISRDGGQTWTPAMDILAPGVQGIWTHFGFDVGKPGQVAFSYLGKAAGRNGFDGYITQTSDAFAVRPMFWSAPVNAPSEAPLDYGGKGSSGGLGLDYNSVMIAPDGEPWASFWDDCGEVLPQTNAGCPISRRPPPDVVVYGYVDYAGRLAPAPPSSTKPSKHKHKQRKKKKHKRPKHGRSPASFTG